MTSAIYKLKSLPGATVKPKPKATKSAAVRKLVAAKIKSPKRPSLLKSSPAPKMLKVR